MIKGETNNCTNGNHMKTILYNLIQLNATILDWLTKQYLIRYGGCTKKIKRSGQILIKYLER